MTTGPGEPDATGWFAYQPVEARDDVPDAPVRYVELRTDEYGGPCWSSDEALGDDFDELHAWIGISRPLYDDVMAWHAAALAAGADAPATFDAQQDLLRRLADEVPAGIEVPAPRARPPAIVSVLRDDLEALPIPDELRARASTWKAAAGEHGHAAGGDHAATRAWIDAGAVLGRELSEVLGDDYVVLVF